MNIRGAGAWRRALCRALACAVLFPGPRPAAAQRSGGEPEANPDFQQQLQPSAGGGPLGGDSAPAPGAPSPEPGGTAAPEVSPLSPAAGVQIGAAAAPREAPERSVSPLDTRVTVRVKGAPLATFLDTISAQAKVNFIITEGLESKQVTAFLQNVTVREALQVLLEIRGLTYQQIGRSNTYVITPRSKEVENLITRIYTLNYVPLIPLVGDGQSMSLIGEEGGSGGASGLMSVTGAGRGGGGEKDKEKSDVAIINVIRSVLSARKGHVELEPRTNSIVVTDIPEVFPQVEQIIAELDKKPPQVMIEAQIVEIDSNRSRELGFEWGGANGELASFRGGARDTTFPLNAPKNMSRLRFFDPLNPSAGVVSQLQNAGGGTSSAVEGSGTTAARDSGVLLTSVVDLTSLQVTLRALVSRSEARFLGKPKIMTLNNKTATIQIASREAVGFQIQQANTVGAGGLTVSGVERFPTGLILRVTPQVNKEGFITMLVQPSFTDVQEASISVASNRVFNPIQRGATALVRVKNGQTLVLGGLLRSTETKVVRKVPLLGYIPVLGWLFTSTSFRRVNSDLVIFLTPTIVTD